MQILFHLGSHCTDKGLLIRSILRNREALAREGIGIPGPGRYRELLSSVSTSLRGQIADEATEDMLLEAIRDDDTAERVILSNENFLCRDKVALEGGRLYLKAFKAEWLENCFPSHTAEFAIALRNPATFLPDLLAREDDSGQSLADLRLADLLWSDVVLRLQKACPGARILAWCHEDTPFIWEEIMREMTLCDPFTDLSGEFDMLEQIMSETGITRLHAFLDARDVTSTTRRRATIAAFLEAHGLEEKIEAEIDLPGWTSETIDDLSALYDEDVAKVAAMPGVEFIQP